MTRRKPILVTLTDSFLLSSGMILADGKRLFYLSTIRRDGSARMWPYRSSPLPRRLP